MLGLRWGLWGLALCGPLTGAALAQAQDQAQAQAAPAHHGAGFERSRSHDVAYLSAGAFVFGAGARVGAYVAPDVGVDVDGQLAAMLLMGESRSLAAGVHYFLGETTYVRAALRVRWETLSLELFEPLFSGDEFEEWHYQIDLGPDMAIGHRWQWGTFFLEVEWAGLYVPVVALDVERRTVDPENGEILSRKGGSSKLYPYGRALFLQVGASL